MTKVDSRRPRRIISGAPKTRSRNGCLTCRKRKKKCDERGPVCAGCERNFLQCTWPEHRKLTTTAGNLVSVRSALSISVELEDGNNQNAEQNLEVVDIPMELCSVFEIPNYKHEKPRKNFEDVINIGIKQYQIFENVSEQRLYDDLMAYKPQTNLPNISVKSPLEASFREIIYANGCSLMGKSESAQRHCLKANDIIKGNKELVETWESLAIKTITLAENKMSLCTRASFQNKNIINLESLNKTLFYEFLFSYPMLIYFEPIKDSLISPFQIFNKYNEDFLGIFETNIKENWLTQVLETSIYNIFTCLIKLSWLIRNPHFNEKEKKNELMKLKSDISMIWTTLQTTEIQLDNTQNTTIEMLGLSAGVKSQNNNAAAPTIEFAKLSYMSLEILYLKTYDSKVSNNYPIIGFYLDQFINYYESFLNFADSNDEIIPKYMFIFPLFIVACASTTLEQREFISKELYLISYDLKMTFVEALVNQVEESWGLDFNDNTQNTFEMLINGF